jgi:hypothetical protein
MDAKRFDRLTRSLKDASSRRALLQGVATTTVGLVTLQFDREAEAKKNRKRKKRCRRLGQSCSPAGKRKCCKRNGVICDDTALNRFRCCEAAGASCAAASECCDNNCVLGICRLS